jgi:hypothetical protein
MENKIPLIESFASKTFNRLPFEKRERGGTFRRWCLMKLSIFCFLKKGRGCFAKLSIVFFFEKRERGGAFRRWCLKIGVFYTNYKVCWYCAYSAMGVPPTYRVRECQASPPKKTFTASSGAGTSLRCNL